jgi:hypothetical protein
MRTHPHLLPVGKQTHLLRRASPGEEDSWDSFPEASTGQEACCLPVCEKRLIQFFGVFRVRFRPSSGERPAFSHAGRSFVPVV